MLQGLWEEEQLLLEEELLLLEEELLLLEEEQLLLEEELYILDLKKKVNLVESGLNVCIQGLYVEERCTRSMNVHGRIIHQIRMESDGGGVCDLPGSTSLLFVCKVNCSNPLTTVPPTTTFVTTPVVGNV